jgi:hypothetical protein
MVRSLIGGLKSMYEHIGIYWCMMHLKEYVLAQETSSEKWVLHSLLTVTRGGSYEKWSFGEGFLNFNQIKI